MERCWPRPLEPRKESIPIITGRTRTKRRGEDRTAPPTSGSAAPLRGKRNRDWLQVFEVPVPVSFDHRGSMSADLLHGFTQRGPFLIQAFLLDLPELRFGDVEFFRHDLAGTRHIGNHVLSRHERMKNFASLLQSQAFGTHGTLLP